MAKLANYVPVRKIEISRRALTGRVQSSGGGGLSFESSLERDWLLSLDSSPDVTAIREQPFTLIYLMDGRRLKYTPDVLAEHVTRTGCKRVIVYEVKCRDDLVAEWTNLRPRFKAAVAYCRARGWGFKIVTEEQIRTPFLQNAKFLRRYRAIEGDTLVRNQLLYTFKALGETTPQALLAASYWDEESQLKALPQLWKLVGERVIHAELNDPLSMSCRMWANPNA
jgi:hypothetical protein